MAIAWLLGNTLSTGGSNLNSAGSATALEYRTSRYFDDIYFTYDEAQPTRLTFAEPGDYLISAGLPMTSNGDNTGNRNDITQELRLNGTLIPGGYSDSSYIRNTSGHFESSNRSTTVVLGASAGDYVEHYIYRGSSETTNIVTDDGHSLYAEYITDKTAFIARATQTTDSTNLNQSTAYPLEWSTVDRSDDGYTHNAGSSPEALVIDKPGRYIIYCNIPLSTSVQRGNITARVLLDGVQVAGGQFQQGMVRNADGINTGSCHFAGLITVTDPGQTLTVTTEQEAVAGTVTVGSYYANIIVLKTWSDVGIYNAEATQVNNGSNWNPSTKKAINWSTDNLLDEEYFTHSTSSSNDQIFLNKDGDYYVAFNVAFQGAVARANPKATLQVNGVDMPGFQGKAGYIRNTSGADSSSTVMVGLLPGLHAGDVITVSMDASAANGTITCQGTASLTIRGKNLPIAAAFWFSA